MPEMQAALQSRVDARRKTRSRRQFSFGGLCNHHTENRSWFYYRLVGILSEAAHSGLDLIAALVTFFSVRVSDKPADADHQYGHGKVENFSAFIETGLLLLTCIWIISEAVKRLFFQSVEIEPSVAAFLVMLLSIVVDAWRSRSLGRIAMKYDSQALEADALHFSTDIWSSSVVILGLVAVQIGRTYHVM